MFGPVKRSVAVTAVSAIAAVSGGVLAGKGAEAYNDAVTRSRADAISLCAGILEIVPVIVDVPHPACMPFKHDFMRYQQQYVMPSKNGFIKSETSKDIEDAYMPPNSARALGALAGGVGGYALANALDNIYVRIATKREQEDEAGLPHTNE